MTADSDRTILLATDLGPRSDRALERARLLAEAWKARLVVVHALEDKPQTLLEPPDGGAAGPLTLAASALDELSRDLGDQPGVSLHVVEGRPEEAITEHAAAAGSALVVAGVARDDGAVAGSLGRTLDRLLRRAGPPVLIARTRPRGPYGAILVASDLTKGSANTLLVAGALFPDAALTLFHSSDPPFGDIAVGADDVRDDLRRRAERNAAEMFDKAGLPPEARPPVVAEVGPPGLQAAAYATAAGVDLVVVGMQERSLLVDLLAGSTGKIIADAVDCDVLIVRGGEPDPAPR